MSVLFVMFVPVSCFHCFIYCHAGSAIQTEAYTFSRSTFNIFYDSVGLLQSLAVADALYSMEWYRLSSKIKLVLLFAMMRAQERLALKTKFFEANLLTYSSVFEKDYYFKLESCFIFIFCLMSRF